MSEGRKDDSGKPPLDLIPQAALEEIAKVLGHGARKYARHNWRGGINYSRLIAAALRHIGAFNDGNDTDEESGLSHIGHALCCLAFLQTFISESRKELDDRYNAKQKEMTELLNAIAKAPASESPFSRRKSDKASFAQKNGLSERPNITAKELNDEFEHLINTFKCHCANPNCPGSGAI